MAEIPRLDTETDDEIIVLEDATLLTRGNTTNSVESKRSPYTG
ncbi:hypothetical protein [Streptomyces uncialis]